MRSPIRFRSTRVTLLGVAALVIVLVALSSAADRLLDPSLYLPESPLAEAIARHDGARDTHSRASDIGIPSLNPIGPAPFIAPDLLATAMANAFPTAGVDPIALAKSDAPVDEDADESSLPCVTCPGERESLLTIGLNANSLEWPLLFPVDPVMVLGRSISSSFEGSLTPPSLPPVTPQPPSGGGQGGGQPEDPGAPPAPPQPPRDGGPNPPPPDEPPSLPPPDDGPHDPTPVPEPATLLVTALGFGGMTIARRMRARS